MKLRLFLLLTILASGSLYVVSQAAPPTPPPNNTGGEFFSPADSLKQFTVPDDLKLEQVLAEPLVKQPIFLNFDERGRMWVINYLQYPYPEGLRILSKDKHHRAVYDKVPLPPPHGDKGDDQITIHEDTNGDGKYDKHSVFLDDLNIASSFVKGRGGVWVLNPPYLLFYPDKNNDDVPDGDPVVHLEGFGMEDTHSVVNSLRWGPDGWLYSSQGSTVSGKVKKPGQKDSEAIQTLGQLIWRYHPEKKIYEIFAEGGGNAFGVEIDDKGRLYSGHNGGNTRGFHYTQGSYYQKGFGKHGPLSNPYAFGYFQAMKHAKVPRFTHNFIIYEAETLPKKYWGHLFGIEPLQGRVVESAVTADGSSYQTEDLQRPVATTDKRFRPVDIKLGPDGAIYFCDMYEHQIAHGQHYSGQVEKGDGRIYRLTAKDARPLAPFDLGKKSSQELIAVLDHPNRWFRQQALRLFGDRKDASVIPALKQKLFETDGQSALEALWALNLSGGFDEAVAAKSLKHADPFVRAWTIRLLCDDHRVSPEIGQQLIALALTEPHVQVRSQLASSSKRLPADPGLPIAFNLLTRSEDLDDVHIPLILWWSLEKRVNEDRDALLAYFAKPEVWQSPLVEKYILERIMRRFAATGSRNDLLVCAKLLELAPEKSHAEILMSGFETAMKGRSTASFPKELVAAMSKYGGQSISLGLRQGDKEAIQKALKIVADSKADNQKRLDLIQIFGEVKVPACVPVLLDIISNSSDLQMQIAAISALQQYPDDTIGKTVTNLYPNMSDDLRSAAQTLLTIRKAWAKDFLQAIDAGKINKTTVPVETARKMTVFSDDGISNLIQKHFGSIAGATTEQMQQQIAAHQKMLLASQAEPDRYAGEKLFQKHCGKCHKLFGDGGEIGPDLTSFKRDDVGRMLVNIVNPSNEIREGFETYLVVTDDGRVVNGFLADQDNNVIVIRSADGQSITVERDNIDEMLPQKKSLMPEGLLDKLSDQEIQDLFSYLRSSQPLP
ncbi:PVC-type heme-binding CxxCH protein [Gimesia chilikensis]|uniref:PVC-type heme-binding CxxCH protein n=1 Tax=Gimesia chilikensis TaxID=2605989 RepID=UPI001188D77E|nr:PVC-type heme-binding CxxCH protein [Gimesia chilikensis]QDT82617.1 Cytochrome c [Gimesia chilikensis]